MGFKKPCIYGMGGGLREFTLPTFFIISQAKIVHAHKVSLLIKKLIFFNPGTKNYTIFEVNVLNLKNFIAILVSLEKFLVMKKSIFSVPGARNHRKTRS